METLPGLNIDQYNILLLGAIGAGKSSFINTVSTVFTGDVVPIAPARQAEVSVTSKVCKMNSSLYEVYTSYFYDTAVSQKKLHSTIIAFMESLFGRIICY